MDNVEEKVDEKTKNKYYTIQSNGKEIGTITIEKAGDKTKVIFEISKEEKEKRIENILKAIKNGLYSQSSNEANTILPLFLIAAQVKVPVPVFHPYLELAPSKDNTYKVKGLTDAISNSWIEERKICIVESEKIKAPEDIDIERISWDEFLKELGLSNETQQSQASNS